MFTSVSSTVGSASIYNGIITAPRTPRPNLDSIINESSNLGRALTLVLRRKWHIDGPLSECRVGRDRYLWLRACGQSDGLRASQIPFILHAFDSLGPLHHLMAYSLFTYYDQHDYRPVTFKCRAQHTIDEL